MITRRRFIQIAAVCAAPVAVGAAAWNDSARSFGTRVVRRLDGFARSPEARLTAHFGYLKLDPAGVRQFFADYAGARPNFSRRSPLPADAYTRYLLSTDFFQGGADESREVRYVLFYDPGATACYNPLATFDEVPEASGSGPGRVSGVVEHPTASRG